jgi:hypothetical protein
MQLTDLAVSLQPHFEEVSDGLANILDTAQWEKTDAILSVYKRMKVISTYLPTATDAGYGPGHQRDPNFHGHLGRSMDVDHKQRAPYRSALVVNAKTGIPGLAFFEKARSHGHKIAYQGVAPGPDEWCERDFWFNQVKLLGLDPARLNYVV